MGQLVSRGGDSLSTGHTCAATTTLATPGQGDVYANGVLIARITDSTVAHPFPPDPPCAPHVATVGAGSPTVFVHGLKATFITAAADAGAMTGGATNVYVATSATAIAADLGVEIWQPNVGTPAEVEAFSQSVYEGMQTNKADLGEEGGKENEIGEYGDGGINSARFTNTSPTNNIQGVQNTESADGLGSDSSFEPGSGTGLVFLAHTDPRVSPTVIAYAEALSAAVGYPLTITSAYRSPAYNKKVGGAKGSVHQQGLALDIVQTGLTTTQRQNFITAAYNAGFRGIGVYNTFTHIDISTKRAWGARNGSRTSLPDYPWAQAVLGPLGYAIQ